MSKEENVIKFYNMCNRLKTLTRKGWKDWHVGADRIESVAEHIYGTQMLAIAINSEFNCNVDITKVIFMLSIHEIGENLIGDLTQFQITKEEKKIIEHMAVHDILSGLIDGDKIEELYLDFDEHRSKEALFAHLIDKLECDLQAKLYGEDNLVDLSKQDGNNTFKDPRVQKLLNSGYTWEEMWMIFGQMTYNYNDNFMAVSNYALHNKIKDNEHNKELIKKYKEMVKKYSAT